MYDIQNFTSISLSAENKNSKAKLCDCNYRAGNRAQRVVECLTTIYEALGWIPVLTRKEEGREAMWLEDRG